MVKLSIKVLPKGSGSSYWPVIPVRFPKATVKRIREVSKETGASHSAIVQQLTEQSLGIKPTGFDGGLKKGKKMVKAKGVKTGGKKATAKKPVKKAGTIRKEQKRAAVAKKAAPKKAAQAAPVKKPAKVVKSKVDPLDSPETAKAKEAAAAEKAAALEAKKAKKREADKTRRAKAKEAKAALDAGEKVISEGAKDEPLPPEIEAASVPVAVEPSATANGAIAPTPEEADAGF